jgi:tRNA1Val (adenine37-N6)-methyltransferase
MPEQKKIKMSEPGSPLRRRRGEPNSFFQFKQFTIQQDRCAMKVCTDACILGAWVADKMEGAVVKNILDIGSGTGLLSLMLAQKIDAETDAIEINEDAAIQAIENISGSAWAEKINVINISLQDIIPQKKYDLIICNPPFYENDLRSGDEHKNAAKHDLTLRLDELLLFVKKYLETEGYLFLLLPFHRTAYLERTVNEQGLFVQEKLLIKQSPGHAYFRSVFLISQRKTVTVSIDELIIHDNERQYTLAFQALLKDYYLKL